MVLVHTLHKPADVPVHPSVKYPLYRQMGQGAQADAPDVGAYVLVLQSTHTLADVVDEYFPA
jgi:hypothetical protein